MNKKTLAAATLVTLAGLYLGCTNPQSAIDPRVQAGNAVDSTPSAPAFSKANATGYWMVQRITSSGSPDNQGFEMILRQDADGKLVGKFEGQDLNGVLKDGTNTDGQLSFHIGTYDNPVTGAISDDGKTVELSFTGGSVTYRWMCTRLL